MDSNKLHDIITETINNLIKNKQNKHNDFDLSKYLDTVPYEELINQYEDYTSQEKINGFKTLRCLAEDINNKISSAKQAKNEIMKKYNLKDWQVVITTRNNNVEVIVIYAGILKNTKIIKQEMEKLGFFDSFSWVARKRTMIWRALKFEPLYQKDLTDEAFQFGVLYHLSLKKNLHFIKTQGLVPSHKNNLFKYPNRVYVFKGNTPIDEIIYLGSQLYQEDKSKDNNGHYILYRIDTSKIPDNVRFYGDPNYKYGYFTEGTIPTQALSVIESIEY